MVRQIHLPLSTYMLLTVVLSTVLLEQRDVCSAVFEGAVRVSKGSVEIHSNNVLDGDGRRGPATAVDTAVQEVLCAIGSSGRSDVR